MKLKSTLLTVLLASLLNAQLSDCTTLLEQNGKIEVENEELSKQVTYYKNLLNVSTAIRSASFENVQYDIKTVHGSKKDGTIMIEFTYKNKSKNPLDLQIYKAVLLDPLGKQFQTLHVLLSTDGRVQMPAIIPEVNYRGASFFKNTSADFPLITALALYIYPQDKISNPKPVLFQNIPVIWD